MYFQTYTVACTGFISFYPFFLGPTLYTPLNLFLCILLWNSVYCANINAKIGWTFVTFNHIWGHTYSNNIFAYSLMNALGMVGLTLKLDKLVWPTMTFEVLLISIKYLRIHNVSIHINFYQNQFINKCVRKKKKVGQNWMKFCDLQWPLLNFL